MTAEKPPKGLAGRLVRENRQLRDKLRRAERALREGRSWESYKDDDAIEPTKRLVTSSRKRAPGRLT